MLVHYNFLAVIPRGRELQKLVARYEKVCGPEADLFAGMFRLFFYLVLQSRTQARVVNPLHR